MITEDDVKGYPERYVVFDTESHIRPSARPNWDHDQTLRLGVAKIYDPVVYPAGTPLYARFDTSAEFAEILGLMPHDKVPIYVFAHNIGYDLRIVDWFRLVTAGKYTLTPPAGMPGEGRYKTPLFVFDGTPILMRFFRDDGQIVHLWDSFNWLQCSLAKVGEMIGMAKGVMPDFAESDEVWYDYCQRDVDVLDRALRQLWGWLQCLRIDSWAATPAALAAMVYRMRFAKGRIKRPADPEPVKLDRMAYYGGKVECFRIGRYDKQSYQVDCNGLYPYVMMNNQYPCEVKSYDHGDGGIRPADLVDERWATAEVGIEAADAAVPVRGRDGTIYVRGRVRTVLAGPELHAALADGVVNRVYRWTSFQVDDLFSAYVKCFQRLREKARGRGDGLVDRVCKQLLNSLHGKFGQRDGQWYPHGRTETPGTYTAGKLIDRDRSLDLDSRVLDGYMFLRARDEEHDQAFVPIAAWTASYARKYMDEVIHMVGPDNVLYQCVDSLILTQDGYDRLHDAGMCDTGKLGDFKTEDSYEWIDIQAPNQVDHCHGAKHSGVKPGSAAVAPGVYEVEAWEGLQEGIFAGNISSVSTRKTLVRPTRHYARRRVLPDGRTEPWTIDNWRLSPEQQSDVPVRCADSCREQ